VARDKYGNKAFDGHVDTSSNKKKKRKKLHR
jgi:hypothetical protein